MIASIVGAALAPFLLLSLGFWALHTLMEKPEWEIPVLGVSVILGCGFIGNLPVKVWIKLLIGVVYVPVFTFVLFIFGWIFLTEVLDRPMKLW